MPVRLQMTAHAPRAVHGRSQKAPLDRIHNGCATPIRTQAAPIARRVRFHHDPVLGRRASVRGVFALRRQQRSTGRQRSCRFRASVLDYRLICAIDTRRLPGGLNEISLILRFFTRTMIVPSSRTVKCIRSPDLRFAATRIALGIVVCPLLVTVAKAIRIHPFLTNGNTVSTSDLSV